MPTKYIFKPKFQPPKTFISFEEQLRSPNLTTKDGSIILRTCFNCEPILGKTNYSPAIEHGRCAWCGWSKEKSLNPPMEEEESQTA